MNICSVLAYPKFQLRQSAILHESPSQHAASLIRNMVSLHPTRQPTVVLPQQR